MVSMNNNDYIKPILIKNGNYTVLPNVISKYYINDYEVEKIRHYICNEYRVPYEMMFYTEDDLK